MHETWNIGSSCLVIKKVSDDILPVSVVLKLLRLKLWKETATRKLHFLDVKFRYVTDMHLISTNATFQVHVFHVNLSLLKPQRRLCDFNEIIECFR